ncbi:nuclear transport factor 2 family protein [Novosphingobium album (ex Liu et al. 2023)]|uniref:Nuclear transport factor 2 family protein n=1 Tax=Novosphingobium album (ex Liu et al. 2023) TaxID=3031130 RepID=A0ABT5WQ97_9SPHN|nr:nuclear transport factor 2 family protein [Novosphingobium album (ex Liu et al. 2023)]MDE8652209.1 nuclear transport factor 2 family protein [Novosphingobium album (ex Liu et al. 2023)]
MSATSDISASTAGRIAIARDFLLNIGRGGIDPRHYADDLTAWSPLMGMIGREDYLPKLRTVGEVWTRPLAVTIDTVTAQDDRVVIQARSQGLLYDGREYANTYLFLVEFDAQDRIRHVREYFDPDPVRDILQPAVARWRSERLGNPGLS